MFGSKPVNVPAVVYEQAILDPMRLSPFSENNRPLARVIRRTAPSNFIQ